jgi:hypothetical protein
MMLWLVQRWRRGFKELIHVDADAALKILGEERVVEGETDSWECPGMVFSVLRVADEY